MNTVYINRTLETRAARIALLLIRNPRRRLSFPAKHERLVTEQELARLGL
ncbi:MAG: hypothetical protein ACRDUX_20565 [Mycobacterium sp.]